MEQRWIWQQQNWPNFTWQESIIEPLLKELRLKQGELLGRAGAINIENQDSLALDLMLQNIITSSAIEGENLNRDSVRSSLAKRLSLTQFRSVNTTKQSEGLATILMDVVNNADHLLDLNRLFLWHESLFPESELSIYDIKVACLRGDEPMQVVSGRDGRYQVHFEAPPRSVLEFELNRFITWFNQQQSGLDLLLRAAITHFWFVTLHPFDDGNGRLTRSLTDLALQQDHTQSVRFYAMSAAILENRKDYYEVLEASQKGGLDLTKWLEWFLITLKQSMQATIDNIEQLLAKARFWQQHKDVVFLKEHLKVLNKLLDGGDNSFKFGINANKYQAIAKVSKATATRHLAFLVKNNCLEKLPGGGRSTRYQINYY